MTASRRRPGAPGGEKPKVPGRATALVGAGLLLAVVTLMMFEQSARWLLTAAARGGFVRDEFEITHMRDTRGRGGFSYGGQVVSSGETVSSKTTIIVSLDRLRELDAAGKIPGAREPVHYLPPRAPWTVLDYVVRFRVQAPEPFETNAFGWTIVNIAFGVGAAWMIRRGVRIAKQAMGTKN